MICDPYNMLLKLRSTRKNSELENVRLKIWKAMLMQLPYFPMLIQQFRLCWEQLGQGMDSGMKRLTEITV